MKSWISSVAPFGVTSNVTRLRALPIIDRRSSLTLTSVMRSAGSVGKGSPEFHEDFIGVSEGAARFLVDRGVKVVGVDYLSVEPYKTPGAPTHHVLLGAGTIVIEGLNLRDVEPGTYEMFCLPLAVVGADGAPARVILRRS